MWLEPIIVSVLNHKWRRHSEPSVAGLMLGRAADESHRAIVWPDDKRAEHAVVVGKTGSGKTHCMESLASSLMKRSEPFVFFDYHGDATQHLVRLASVHPDGARRLVVVDPTDPQCSPGLNPLEIRSAAENAFGRSAELAAILRARWGVDAFGARTEELLRNTLFVLSANSYTLVEAPLLLTSRPFRDQLVMNLGPSDIADYWRDRYEPLSDPMKAAFREPLLNKITGFLTEPACRHLLGQPKSTFTFADAIERGQWIILHLPKGKLRDHAHTLGNLIFARLQFELFARVNQPEHKRRLVTVFCDEVQNLAENGIATLLAEGRKFRGSIVCGLQYWEEISRELRGALLSAGTHMFFQVSASDAGVLASELSVAAKHRYHEDLTTLPRGEAIVRIGATAPVHIRVPPLPKVRSSDSALSALHSLSSHQYAVDRSEIEREIQARRAAFRSSPITQLTKLDATDEGQADW